MYLAAQWVRARDGSRHLNAVLYLHRDVELPDGFWSRPAEDILRTVSTTQPGKRVAARLDAIPGGNDVECFLDVIGPDDTPLELIEAAIDALRTTLEANEVPRAHVVHRGVIAEFSVVLDPASARLARFDELRQAAASLYADPREPPFASSKPLTIEVATDEEAMQFRLSDDSAARLLLADLDRTGFRDTVTIRADVKDAFERFHGSIYPHVAEWLTKLPREKLFELGGLRFVADGHVLFDWPAR